MAYDIIGDNVDILIRSRVKRPPTPKNRADSRLLLEKWRVEEMTSLMRWQQDLQVGTEAAAGCRQSPRHPAATRRPGAPR